MPDAFSSPEYQPSRLPRHQAPHQPSSPPQYQPSHHYPQFPNSSPPSYATYPWQPPPPEPERRRLPRHQALGHHSDLRLLRGAYRRQRRVATLTALGYFTLFLLLSAFAPDLMTSTVSGGLSTGLLLGLLQVPVTCLAIGLYEYSARRRVDPIADRIRKQAELDAKREAAR
ncbi:DUF485 domain-containing protein [Streptomyces sp. NPDC050564]|uniref:DUF485 domain-containing protein n=1 Tax=Streptomyces sp. NPDC050564 TaxID=3365631 RepID=UPI003787C6D5